MGEIQNLTWLLFINHYVSLHENMFEALCTDMNAPNYPKCKCRFICCVWKNTFPVKKQKLVWLQNEYETAISTNNFDKIHVYELACIFSYKHSITQQFYSWFQVPVQTFQMRYHTSSYLQSSSRYWLLKWCHAWVIIRGATNQHWFKGQPT